MELICSVNKCTGCGMCSNICPKGAITIKPCKHDFVFPVIDKYLCIDCGLCKQKCPANKNYDSFSSVKSVYAAWNKNNSVRKKSTSGGVFGLLAEKIIIDGGVVAGVAWDENFHPEHVIVNSIENLPKFYGSKYSQSNTGNIYRTVKEYLDNNIKVLFSGTPCQVAALKSYCSKNYSNLFCIDIVCHGVPSNIMLDKHLLSFKRRIKNVRLRYKDPFWDYTYVRVDFDNGPFYQKLTIDDDYFNIFNIGYSLRISCHNCKYTNLNRQGDITLADFWGYIAHNYQSRNYNKGTSLVLINSDKGAVLFNSVKDRLFVEESNIELAKRGNKCLSEPFRIDDEKLNNFWYDYEKGMTIEELNKKYCKDTFILPKHMCLRRLYYKWKWIIGR